MICAVCMTTWYPQSWSSPAESCDCGACLSAEAAREMTPEQLAEMQTHTCEGCDARDGLWRTERTSYLCDECEEKAEIEARRIQQRMAGTR